MLALRVAGVTPGCLPSLPPDQAACTWFERAPPRTGREYLAGQSWYAGAAAVVFMTAVLPRVWWRGPTTRERHRAALLEAGHVCQTFCLVATWLGLAPFCTMALDDTRIERDLAGGRRREVLCTRPAWARGPGTDAGCSGRVTRRRSARPSRGRITDHYPLRSRLADQARHGRARRSGASGTDPAASAKVRRGLAEARLQVRERGEVTA